MCIRDRLNTWARLVVPDTAVLIVQATPWSPATPGPVTGDVVFVSIQDDKDIDQYKGKLAGKIVLYGAMREVPPVDKALFDRYSDKSSRRSPSSRSVQTLLDSHPTSRRGSKLARSGCA